MLRIARPPEPRRRPRPRPRGVPVPLLVALLACISCAKDQETAPSAATTPTRPTGPPRNAAPSDLAWATLTATDGAFAGIGAIAHDDFDGDGESDVAVYAESADEAGVFVFYGPLAGHRETGSADAFLPYADADEGIHAGGDLDHDGNADLLVTATPAVLFLGPLRSGSSPAATWTDGDEGEHPGEEFDGALGSVWGPGTTQVVVLATMFDTPDYYGSGIVWVSESIRDFDLDSVSYGEVGCRNDIGNRSCVFLQNGDPLEEVVLLGDVDGDGGEDLGVEQYGHHVYIIAPAKDGGMLDDVASVEHDHAGGSIPIGDMNGDGYDDFAVEYITDALKSYDAEGETVLYAGGSGTLSDLDGAAARFPQVDECGVTVTGGGDGDGDGYADLAVQWAEDRYVYVHPGPLTGEILVNRDAARVVLLPEGSGRLGGFATGDLDGDRLADLVVLDASSDDVHVAYLMPLVW